MLDHSGAEALPVGRGHSFVGAFEALRLAGNLIFEGGMDVDAEPTEAAKALPLRAVYLRGQG